MKEKEGYVRKCVFCTVLLSVILASSTVFGATLRVPSEYFTIQKAIDAASALDVVIVADGTWKGTGFKNLNFDGKAITVRSENGPENCIIDCEGDGKGFDFSNSEGKASEVSGFTITNASEGGIYCGYSSPTITNCIITGNTNTDYGGGISSYGSPTIINCVITGNTADNGGGIYSGTTSDPPTITGCIISNNSASKGGGIYCHQANISKCTISNNLAAENGGGVYCGDANITNCVISNNTANDSGSDGGGIYCSGSPIVTNCTITDNSANNGGGGTDCYYSTITIINSIC